MSEHSRRSILSGGFRAALGTALVLPWSGGGALAVPESLAGQCSAVGGPWPVSAETHALRDLLARRAALYASRPYTQAEEQTRDVAVVLNRIKYGETADRVLDRPTNSWGHVAELAEIAWACWPKVWYGQEPGRTPGLLDLEGRQDRIRAMRHEAAAAQLIHAVVMLTGGELFAPMWPGEPMLDRRVSREELTNLCTQN